MDAVRSAAPVGRRAARTSRRPERGQRRRAAESYRTLCACAARRLVLTRANSCVIDICVPARLPRERRDEARVQLATRIPKALLMRLRVWAVQCDTTIMQFVEDAIRERLGRSK